MQLTDAQNLWNLDFGQETSKLQQGFTREQWQYQDTTQALTQGWQAEDYAEAIRFSTGRERRNLIKQRDRATVMQGLEGEQIDQSRSQQEQLWAREDERYEKQREYITELMGLEKEQWDLNEEQRKASIELDKQQWALNKEQREANFKYEQEQLARAKEEYQKQYDLQTKIIAGRTLLPGRADEATAGPAQPAKRKHDRAEQLPAGNHQGSQRVRENRWLCAAACAKRSQPDAWKVGRACESDQQCQLKQDQPGDRCPGGA